MPCASLVARLPDGEHLLSSTGRDGRAAFRLPCPASACSLEVVQPAYLPYTGPLAPAVTLRAAVLPPTVSERIVFTPGEGFSINRMEQNEEITAKFLNDTQFREAVSYYLLREVYEQIRKEGPRE